MENETVPYCLYSQISHADKCSIKSHPLTQRHNGDAACEGGCLQKGSAGPPIPPCALTLLCPGTRYRTTTISEWAGSELLLEGQNCCDSHHSNASAWAGRGRGEEQAIRPEPSAWWQPVSRAGWGSHQTVGLHPLLSQSTTQGQTVKEANNTSTMVLKKKKSVILHKYRHLYCTVTILP